MTEIQIKKEPFPEDAAESFLYLLYFMLCLLKKVRPFYSWAKFLLSLFKLSSYFTVSHENYFGTEYRSLFGENKPPFLPAIFNPGVNFNNFFKSKFLFESILCSCFVITECDWNFLKSKS